MTITLENVSKRFGREWILKNVNYEFSSGNSYAILGPNGSGKSTLMQMLAGSISPNAGTIKYSDDGKRVGVEDIFRHLAYCAPYMQLIEEFTLQEQLDFHFKFKSRLKNYEVQQPADLLDFRKETGKQIKFFSSGMKQRVKLALAVLSDVPVLLLDEPATNLDAAGIMWYQNLLAKYSNGRLLVISSNRKDEYEMCRNRLDVLDFK